MPIAKRNRSHPQPETFHRLLRTVTIHTPRGPREARALFDTGANVFVLDHGWAKENHIFRIERQHARNILGFGGKVEHGAGKAFSPYLSIQVNSHESTISCELATLEPGIQVIIPGG